MDAAKIGTVIDIEAAPSDGSGESDTSNSRNSLWHRVPVVHWKEAQPPLVMCVAMGRTGGAFEQNVAELAEQLQLREGVHYWHFN